MREPAVDRFTIGHAMVGFLLGMWGMRAEHALVSTVAFEVVENFVLKPAYPNLFPVSKRDTLANATVDSVAWMGGWAIAKSIFEQPAAPMWDRNR